MSKFLDDIAKKILVFDGSKGTMLQKAGMKGGECPELWNATHSDEVQDIFKSYRDAGSDVIQTNTFQGSRSKLSDYSLQDRTYELNCKSAKLAAEVMKGQGYVAASIGPLGKLMEPSGELTFDEAYKNYSEQVKALAEGGVDIINFETFTDVAEMRVALLAAKETVDLPVICSVSFEANGRTLMGTDPYTAAVILASVGADMVGTNCSLGPEHLVGIVKEMSRAGKYLSVKPNAGLPEMIDGEVVFKETPESFARLLDEFVSNGVRLIGGCCGTTPDFIKAISEKLQGVVPPEIRGGYEGIIASSTKIFDLGTSTKADIGRIDSETNKELFSEIADGIIDGVVDAAIDLSCDEHDVVYINVDAAGADDKLLGDIVNMAQGYLKEPVILQTSKPAALERALRLYRGRAAVVIGGSEPTATELESVACKYGSLVVKPDILE